jgi:hypothetical protein
MKITYKDAFEFIEQNKATLTYRHGLPNNSQAKPWALKMFDKYIEGMTAKEAVDNAIYSEIDYKENG